MSPAEPAAPLDAEKLRRALAGQRIGNRVVVLTTATSTNDVVAQMMDSHPEGLVVFAETQTAARGQYGRRWESAAGQGLWFSILLRAGIAVSESARLTDFLARAIAGALTEKAGRACRIKLPNDIYVEDRKIAGILVEMRVEAGGGYAAVAGIGVNVNQRMEDFPNALQSTAGSLALAAARPFDRDDLAIALLREIERGYSALRT